MDASAQPPGAMSRVMPDHEYSRGSFGDVKAWIPAFAGMTEGCNFCYHHKIVFPAKAGIQACAVHTNGMEKQGYVYILASGRNETLYIGVTSDLVKRIYEHRAGTTPGFTSRYGVTRLVHYEILGDMERAIAREKAVKKWRRAWKLRLIERENPDWRDLYPEITGFPPSRE